MPVLAILAIIISIIKKLAELAIILGTFQILNYFLLNTVKLVMEGAILNV